MSPLHGFASQGIEITIQRLLVGPMLFDDLLHGRPRLFRGDDKLGVESKTPNPELEELNHSFTALLLLLG